MKVWAGLSRPSGGPGGYPRRQPRAKDKSFLFGCGGRVRLFVSVFPSDHREEVLIPARRDVKEGLRVRG